MANNLELSIPILLLAKTSSPLCKTDTMTHMNTNLSANVDSSTAQDCQRLKVIEERLSQKPKGPYQADVPFTEFSTRSQMVTASELLGAVESAHTSIAKHVVRTPTIRLPWLDRPGLEVWAKLESQQHSGSFKYRGAINALTSAGNHGLAVAAAGKRLEKAVQVIVPTTASDLKIKRLMVDANVTLLGQDLNEATREAIRIAELSSLISQDKYHYVSPYAELDVAAGAGTLIMETTEDAGHFDSIILPLGGGGLAAAIGSWCSIRSPSTKLICTHPEISGRQFKSAQSISSELLRPTSPTYSDGLAVQLVEQTPFAEILDSTISSVFQVSEYDTTVAIAHALRLQSLLLEGSAATTIAALMTPEQEKYPRGRVLLVLSGGNISSNTVAKALVADVPDPSIRQELGLRHIIDSVERHGAIAMKRKETPETGKENILLSDAWKSLVAGLGKSLRLTKEKFDRQQVLVQQLGLQHDSWSMSVFTELYQQTSDLFHRFEAGLKIVGSGGVVHWATEERFRILIQLQATLASLFERASAASDQSQRNWFFDTEAQHPNACNYDRYGSPNLRNLEQRFLSVLGLGDCTPVELLLTSSGMAAYLVVQNYLLQILAPNDVIVLPPYIYFEAIEQLQGLKHLCVIHAPTSSAEDIIETAERYNARAVFIDPVANLVSLSVTDIRQFARAVSTRSGWSSRHVIMDGTMASGAMSVYDWFHGKHAPKVFYYESASKCLQFGLDLQMGVLLVYPSALDNEMRTIRRNSGAVMYSRNAALLPPLNFSMYQARMSVLTSNSERLYRHLVENLLSIAHIRYPHQWRELGWRHGSALVTIRFLRDGMNNKEGLEACINLILHAAQTLDVPLTKGVSFGFSTSRISSASSMAQGSDPFLRISVGLDMANIDDLAEAVITDVNQYVAVFDGTREIGSVL